MESKRQKQVAEVVRRNFGIVLMQEGSYIYGTAPLVTITQVNMSPDLSIAKIYLSVYNREDKQSVILELDGHITRLRQSLANRVKRHLRRVPELQFYLDETLDEMYELNVLFDKMKEENQMGSEEE